MAAILRMLGLRAPASNLNIPPFPYKITQNPYPAKRVWPPDFQKLSHMHQFRLERRYRRRAKLKWARPTWSKATKLVQWGSILFVTVYVVLYMDVTDDEGRRRPHVFERVRAWAGTEKPRGTYAWKKEEG